jgi:hypothetical protein
MSNLSELLPAGGAAKEFEVVASGTLPNGKPVILNSNGTVTAVAESTVAASTGTEVVFESGTTKNTSVAMLTSTKAIVVYQDDTSTGYGTACVLDVVGDVITAGTPTVIDSVDAIDQTIAMLTSTKAIVCYQKVSGGYGYSVILDVSGSAITAGTPVAYESAATLWNSVAMLTSTKAIVCYYDGGNGYKGTACVLDVSGSTITAGTAIVFNAAVTTQIAVAALSATKAIVVYADNGNSAYGTSCILDVSGSTITARAEAVFESANVGYVKPTMLTSTKALVVYTDNGNSGYGTACVLDVSGSTINAGTPVVFESSTTALKDVDSLNSTTAFVAYQDGGNGSYGTSSVLTISGSTITAATPTLFASASTTWLSVISLTPSKVIITYQDTGNSSYGTCIISQTEHLATNLTSTNFAGTSTAAFTNGQTATIVPQGGVSTNQTSLTIGSTYYVQPAGTLATSAGTPSVVAGKAISATSLILKGNS